VTAAEGYARLMIASAGPDQLTVRIADGRRVEVRTGGPADGLTLVFHSGTPAGLVAFQPLVDAATARGLRTVLYAPWLWQV
jgi:hypothetical protein